MYQYFSINIIVSLLTFLYISQFKTAPARVSFRFVFIALVSWLLPYDLINNYFTSSDYSPLLPALDEFRLNIKTTLVSQISEETRLTLKPILLVLTGLGFIVFIKDIVLLKRNINSLNAKYYKNFGSVSVFITENLDNAFCSGIVKPKIFVNATMINSPEFESILQHELQHIKQHDTIYIAIITFIQRVLWWNPLQLFLTQKARAFLELSCDEETAQKIGKSDYQKNLATLLLPKTPDKVNSLTLSFYTKKELNILRIKHLNNEINMNKKHKSLIFSTAFIPFIISLLISTQSVSSNTTNGDEITTKLKPNQVQVVFDSHVFYNTEYAQDLDDKGTKVISRQDHKSIETNIIATLNEMRKFSFGKEKEEVSFTVNQINKEQYMFDFDITYFIDGQKINLKPSLLVLKTEPASLVSKKDNYRFELNIKIIQ